MRDGWELLFDPPYHRKAARFMQAMVAAAPAGVRVVERYTASRRGLMLYGPGSEARLPIVRRHVAEGGRVAMWDLGYWDRDCAMRLAIDTLHPTAEQLAAAPPGARREFKLREDASEAGPVLLVGLGAKSVFAYGLGRPFAWERRKLAQIRKRWPGREVVWRPKGKAVDFEGLPMRFDMPIEAALAGCSMVVCRHSNVAVDACIAGVPVECEDGAAAALYRGNQAPDRAARAEFLRQLSWWNWRADEATAAWARVMEIAG